VDGAVLLKKITPAEADSFKKLATGNFDVVKSLLDAKQGVQLPTDQLTASGVSDTVMKTFEENKDKGYIWFAENHPKVLESLKKSHPAKYEELVNVKRRVK
jgi:hypothetical protein